MFDPNQFLEMQVTEANDTVLIPIPDGEYPAYVEKVECRPWQKKDDPSVAGLALDLVWNIDDQGVKDAVGRDKVTVKQGIMLDMSESGGLDMGKGKNVPLGKLRLATGLNTPGQPFSFTMLTGRTARIKTKQRMVEDKIYTDVKEVAPL